MGTDCDLSGETVSEKSCSKDVENKSEDSSVNIPESVSQDESEHFNQTNTSTASVIQTLEVDNQSPVLSEDVVMEQEVITNEEPQKEPVKKTKPQSLIPAKVIPRQKPKSGKFWKCERSQFRKIKNDKGQRLTFEKRLKLKEEKARNKEMAAYLLGLKNKKKKEENEKKSEHYQIIKNPAKIKRMKKKQLR